jgi:Spy/CpxP family protein refolding chaperone
MNYKLNAMKFKPLNSILLSFFMLTSMLAFSQMGPPPPERGPRQEKKENIEALKIAFITKKLDLTPEEAQQFWPLYNQYTDKVQDLRRKKRQDNKEAKQNFDEMSDKEIEQAVDNEIIFRQKELDIQKEYHSKFKAILPIKKVARLYQAEEQFKRVLLDKLKDGPPVRD